MQRQNGNAFKRHTGAVCRCYIRCIFERQSWSELLVLLIGYRLVLCSLTMEDNVVCSIHTFYYQVLVC